MKMARRHRTATVLPTFNVTSAISSREQSGISGAVVAYSIHQISEHVNLAPSSSFKSRKTDKLSWSDDEKVVSAAIPQKWSQKQYPTDKHTSNNAIDSFYAPLIMDDFESSSLNYGSPNNDAANSSKQSSVLSNSKLIPPSNIQIKDVPTALIFG